MKERFAQLTRREQLMLIGGGIVLVVIFILRFLWWPLFSGIDRLQREIKKETALIAWMKPRMAQLSQTGQSVEVSKSISQLENDLKTMHLDLYMKHFADDHGSISIHMSAVPMPLLLKWQDQQIAIGWQFDTITLTPARKTGTADVVMLLR